jgi:hypothetical protein
MRWFLVAALVMAVGTARAADMAMAPGCAPDANGNVLLCNGPIVDPATNGLVLIPNYQPQPWNGGGHLVFPAQQPCCVSFPLASGTVTIDLDKGTVDLGGAKTDDAARAFWDAVRTVAHRPAQPRAYTLDEIDRMRAAMKELQYPPCPVAMGRCSPAFTADELESRLRTYMAAGIPPEDLEHKAEGK